MISHSIYFEILENNILKCETYLPIYEKILILFEYLYKNKMRINAKFARLLEFCLGWCFNSIEYSAYGGIIVLRVSNSVFIKLRHRSKTRIIELEIIKLRRFVSELQNKLKVMKEYRSEMLSEIVYYNNLYKKVNEFKSEISRKANVFSYNETNISSLKFEDIL